MSGIAFNIQSEDLQEIAAIAERLGGAVTSNELKGVMGASAFEVIKAHLEKLANDQAHHQTARSLGAEPTGFYERAAGAVQQPHVEPEGVSISIDHQGLAQRLFGGVIEAKPGSYLTIPARAESYGKRAREFDNLQFIVFPSGLAALVAKGEPAHEGAVYYWLVKSVTQSPDRTVLPTEDEILDPVMANARNFIERVWERRGHRG